MITLGSRRPTSGPPTARPLVLGALVLAVVACGPPIHVRRVSPQRVTADLARSALNSDRPSLFTENVLYRWNLSRQYEEDPEAALLALRQKMLADPAGRSAAFALAE